jgi:hypothetical protein
MDWFCDPDADTVEESPSLSMPQLFSGVSPFEASFSVN